MRFTTESPRGFPCLDQVILERVVVAILNSAAIIQPFNSPLHALFPRYGVPESQIGDSGRVVEIPLGHWKRCHDTDAKSIASDLLPADRLEYVLELGGGAPSRFARYTGVVHIPGHPLLTGHVVDFAIRL